MLDRSNRFRPGRPAPSSLRRLDPRSGPDDSESYQLHTVQEIARLLAKLLDEVKVYGAGGCPACYDAEALVLLAQLQKLADG